MTVSITTDNVSFQVFDQETGDPLSSSPYGSMRGSFVGSVREGLFGDSLPDSKACFDVQDFICPQTKRIMVQVPGKVW